MSLLNERQIGLKTGGTFNLLKDYLDKRQVKMMPFNETTALTLSGVSFQVLPSAGWAGTLAVGAATAQNNGAIMVAAGAWTIGTTAFDATTAVDAFGNVLNLVDVRSSVSHDPVLDTDGRKVYGLLTCGAASVDGGAVGTGAGANLEVSFVKNNGAGTFTAVTLTGIYEIHLNKVYQARFDKVIELAGGAKEVDVIADTTVIHYSDYLVTTAFTAGQVLNLTTGAGSGGTPGASTKGGDAAAVQLNSADTAFVADNSCIMTDNGVKGTKGLAAGTTEDFRWASANTVTLLRAFDIGDVIGIERRY